MQAVPDIKEGARKIWASGDYHALARFLPPAAAHVVESAGIKPGDRVLDVACGTGITAITAARAGAVVDGLDLTPELLEVARREDATAGTSVTWTQGDAEDLPYDDDTFDVVVSSFGHMFTPDPAAVTAEMLRVLKPGGRIAFATWPPGSVVGQMLKAVGSVLPPPAGAASPGQWGDEATVTERLGADVQDLKFERGAIAWPSLSPGHHWALFSQTYGPFIAALGKLADAPDKQAQLAAGVQDVFDEHLRGNIISFAFLVTRATKQ